MGEYKLSAISLADEVGVVYVSDDDVLRAIKDSSKSDIEALLGSGLIGELVSCGLFPKTEISDFKIDGYSLVLSHNKIKPLIFPFEWSPEMLRKAALCILDVNLRANRFGYELKDAHPFNVMFEYGSPVFIDLGSFVRINNNAWPAQKQFSANFIYPLHLCKRKMSGIFKVNFLSNEIDEAELAVATNFLLSIVGVNVTRKLFRLVNAYRYFGGVNKEKIHARINNRVMSSALVKLLSAPWMPFRNVDISNLRKKIERINLGAHNSQWGNYHSDYYSESGDILLPERLVNIVSVIKGLKPKSVIEFAGNQGVLSRVISKELGIERVVCTDYDYNAIDTMLLNLDNSEKVSVACFDFMGETWQSLSGERAKRLNSEMVVALAVTHHLVLTQGYSLERILEVLSTFSSKYLLVEFMPLGLWDGHNADPVPEWYTETWFSNVFSKYADLIERVVLEENRILFVGVLKTY